MKTIGITGQNGFVGSHLYNEVSLLKEEFLLIPFEKSFFDNTSSLENWVKRSDVIVHLAALNRHESSEVIHDTNVNLVEKLVAALEFTSHTPHIIFSSSTQEENDNLYGRSKRTGRELLAKWGETNNATITGMIIPNVFGPFGKPFYNSVVATFCHQLCNNLTPSIDKDGFLNLIFVQELVHQIVTSIREGKNIAELQVKPTSEIYVSEILAKLKSYKALYLDKGIIPNLPDRFSLNLFNTFRSYINPVSYFPYMLKPNTDQRGMFVEVIRLEQGGQVSFSTTHSGITRGNHFHTRKIERFTVIKGKALIQLRKYNTTEVLNFELNGATPSYVDMPIWFTHNIKNIGEEDLYTLFWINEFFNPEDADTYFEEVEPLP
jgi:UDP-2-acetamido-2,6-beta-L-arabino-hexul-4-ose reductase